jgi:SH3 domain-containing protein
VGVRTAVASLALWLAAAGAGRADTPEERFRAAGEQLRAGDALKAVALYRDLAASGVESASLYWNWAQAASTRGEVGEALWALLRAREIDPGDRALSREIQRLREGANLDAAEIAPEPLAGLARAGRRFRLGWLVGLLGVVSVAAHLAARLLPAHRWPVRTAWAGLALALALAVVPLAGSLARPTGVVVRRGAPLLEAASPAAGAIGSLRQAEVVPLLERTTDYVRVEDSSGARGWAHADDVWPLERPRPAATPRP